MQGLIIPSGKDNIKKDEGKGSYKDDIQQMRWTPKNPYTTAESSTIEEKEPISRSLVGSFPCDEIPSQNDVRKWAQQTWRGRYNI